MVAQRLLLMSFFSLLGSLAVGLVSWIWLSSSAPPKLNIPIVDFDDGDDAGGTAKSKKRYIEETWKLLTKGYNEHTKNGRAFAVKGLYESQRSGPESFIFIPPQYLEEVRSAPEEKLSLPEYTERSSLLNHVGGPRIVDEVQLAARLAMNRALNNLIPSLQAQCFNAAEGPPFPVGAEWTQTRIYPTILKLFAHMSARVMVGPDLCKGWTPMSAEYMVRIIKAPAAVKANYHPVFYWAAKYLSPEVKAVMRLRRKAAEFIRGTIEARQRDVEANGEAAATHDDMIQWLMDEHRARGQKVTPDIIVQNIFIAMFASMHGTSTITYSVLLDLLADGAIVDEIREEIERVQRTELQGGKVWTRHALGELRILDSCMKETHRMHPFTEVTMQRTAMQDLTFKDGFTVPTGAAVMFPALRHSLDTDIHGPTADTYDPKRFLRRRKGFDTSKFQFPSSSDEWINWGAGPHSCPGRWMADVTIKLILVYFISNFEITFPEGVTARPADRRQGLVITPDMSLSLWFRRIKSEVWK